MSLEILTIDSNEKILRAENKIIPIEDAIPIFRKLETTLSKTKGLGLAAPQIGENVKVFIIKSRNQIIRFNNPEVIDIKIPQIVEGEGCLSIPNQSFRTVRFGQITVKDELNGQQILKGQDAIVFQHEMDHINGVLVIDRAIPDKVDSIIYSEEKTPRNALCPCGSGKKYKKCCYSRCGTRYYPEKIEAR